MKLWASPAFWGRLFTKQDEQGPPAVALMNESMAKRSFPGQNPLGRTLVVEKEQIVRIIGIVPDLRERNLRVPAGPSIYLPYNLDYKGRHNILFRVAPGSGEATPQIKAILNGRLPFKIVKLEDELGDSISSPRFFALIMGLFAAIGIALTTVGISGVTAQSVARRRHEIGVRLALGAEASQVVVMVLRQVILPVVIGLAIGIAGALALTRVFASLLFEIKSTDPVTFLFVSVLSLGAAFLSSYIPARRASLIDPMGTLRCD